MEIIPIFYSTDSRKGILTLDDPKDVKNEEAQSIFKLCKDNDIKKVINISTNFQGMYNGRKIAKKCDLQYIFGLELWVCDDPLGKELAEKSESKVIILFKNEQGYKDLIKIYSKIYTDKNNKYYKYRGSWKLLKENWTDNLVFILPWADSFIYKNTLTFANIVPELPTNNLFIWREINSELPFELLVNKAIDNFNIDKKYEEVNIKTIYYQDGEDLTIESYMIYRGIIEKSDFVQPELNHFCSRNFSFSEYLRLKIL